MMGCSARCCITVPLPSSAHHPPTTGTGRPLTSPQSFALAVVAPCGATDGRRARRTRRRHPVRHGRGLPPAVAGGVAVPSITTADAAAAAGALPPPPRLPLLPPPPRQPAVHRGRARRLAGARHGGRFVARKRWRLARFLFAAPRTASLTATVPLFLVFPLPVLPAARAA